MEALSSIIIEKGTFPTINTLGSFLYQAQQGARYLGYKEDDLKLQFKMGDKEITISIVVDKLINPPIEAP